MGEFLDEFLDKLGAAKEANGETSGRSIDDEAEKESRKFDFTHLNKRNDLYTNILRDYVERSAAISEFKRDKYEVVFNVIVACFIIVIIVFAIAVSKIVDYGVGNGFDVNDIVALVAASVSLASTLLVIPTKIIEFIFDREDDSHISEILKCIQEYDKTVRNYIK